jgi:diacylglycerol kinase family enzyme
VVPCGSGNDFARALKIRSVRDAARAWKSFAAGGEAQVIDLGVITPKGLKASGQNGCFDETLPFPRMPSHAVRRTQNMGSDKTAFDVLRGTENSAVAVLSAEASSNAREHSTPQPSRHYFCCVAGVGIDTEIARRANLLPKWIRARGGYALSAPRQILRFVPFPMRVSSNGDDSAPFHPTILAAVANAPAYGGGMKIAPQADLSDGKLDLCVVRGMNPFKLFCLFPTVYFGRHLGFEEVEYGQTECLHIETEFPLEVYADGEYACKTPAEFSVVRSALNVLTPP